MMLQQNHAEDFLIATGETHTVREFEDLAFKELGIKLEWVDEGEDEKGIEKKTGKVRVEVNQNYFRPTEVELLVGDASKAKRKLDWETKVKFEELVRLIVKADWEKVQKRGY